MAAPAYTAQLEVSPHPMQDNPAFGLPPEYDINIDLHIEGINGLITMTGHRTGERPGHPLPDVIFVPGQTLAGIVDVSMLTPAKRQRLLGSASGGDLKMSELFTVLLVGEVHAFSRAQRNLLRTNRGLNSAGSTKYFEALLITPIVLGLWNIAKKRGKGKGDQGVIGAKSVSLFNLEVPVTDGGVFEITIPDSAILPPDFQSEYGSVSYTMCVISRSRSVVGHHYSLIVDGNLHQHHLLPPRLSLPLSSHLDPEAFAVLSKLLHVHSTISSDHIDVACIPGVPYNATLGYQAVRVRLSVEPSARWRLEALADMFCDVRAHFVHRVSIKGGKYASDFATKDVTARCSLRPLATGETSMLMVDMNLELKRWDCGPQRVSGPFCVIDHPEDEGRALCIPSHVPMEISQFSSPHDSLIFRGPAPVPSVPSPPPPLHPSGDESDAESTGPPSPSAAHDIPATDNPNLEPTRPARRARYLVASEWFVVVKVAIVDDKGGAMNMLRAAVGQKKALAEEDVTLEIPFSCSVRRHTISDDDLPSYMA